MNATAASLTPAQQELWQLTRPHEVEPTGDQSREHTRHFAVESYKQACWFDGVEPPKDDVLYAELDRLRSNA